MCIAPQESCTPSYPRHLPKLHRPHADAAPLIPPSQLAAKEEGAGEPVALTSTTSSPRFSASPPTLLSLVGSDAAVVRETSNIVAVEGLQPL
jgi:hypothetical protein